MVRPAAFTAGFELPDALSAKEPPELRGLPRDGVRLLAAGRRSGGLQHARFRDLPDFLKPGDCLVLNASRTLPASLPARLYDGSGGAARPAGLNDAARSTWSTGPARSTEPTEAAWSTGAAGSTSSAGFSGPFGAARDWSAPGSRRPGAPVEVRLARRLGPDAYSALILDAFGNPRLSAAEGRLVFRDGLAADLEGPDPANSRLIRLRFPAEGAALMERLSRLGQPVRYWYADRPWALDWYQTVFAREPGSMEMPSAGRAFTWRLLLDLRRRGVDTAFLVLHAGLSSYMDAEFDATHPVSVEPYRIGARAAEAVNAARDRGGRIIAVGTTVVRALESAAGPDGRLAETEAVTALRITAGHRLRIADGLITGFHEPEASHLDLLSAFLPPDRLRAVYAEALAEGYLWHEFGDINLIL